jgi:glycosyltransferase involved in cell wall biosynthesis
VILGIDASNIRAGGGVTHLVEVLRAVDPVAHGFTQVVVWGGASTLDRIEDRSWLAKRREPLLENGLLYRSYWQRFRLSRLARAARCDVLLVPGGSFAGDFHPTVTMSRNMLPFEWGELVRYGWTFMTAKLALLRMVQKRAFRRVDGLIFLTEYARDAVMSVIGSTTATMTVIPHGINRRFAREPVPAIPIEEFSGSRPFRILYVSIIDAYKHQWHVADAVMQLEAQGLPVSLELIGPDYPPALQRLERTLARIDPLGQTVRYLGALPHHALHEHYAKADVCVFASSCENMPNILLEGMASGLPIACADRGPMPEILDDGGVYFDPEDPDDIARALLQLIASPALRDHLAAVSFSRSQAFTWARCAAATFDFLAITAAKATDQR